MYSRLLCASLLAVTPVVAQATPFNFVGWLNTAKGGETLVLPAGNYGTVTLPQKAYPRPVRVLAGNATFTKLTIINVKNLSIEGGTIVGPDVDRSIGIDMRLSTSVKIHSMRITKAQTGIGVASSQDIAITNNTFTDLISDGLNIASSQRIAVKGNRCSNFHPTFATYDPATGRMIRDGHHPDCVQAWSRPGLPPTSDVVVSGNRIEGRMQGIFFGNRVGTLPDDGGFDRIKVVDNVLRVGSGNGIRIETGRNSVVIGNTVDSMAGVTYWNGSPALANIVFTGQGSAVACNNNVVARVHAPVGEQACSAAQLNLK